MEAPTLSESDLGSGPELVSKIAPRLLSMLDGEMGPDAVSIAGTTIGRKILGNKTTGAPGSVGWSLFVEPIHRALDPPLSQQQSESGGDEAAAVLTTEEELATALQRLSGIITAHPNPGLVGRLISPVLLPLWGLMGFAESIRNGDSAAENVWVDVPNGLLETYLRISGRKDQVGALVEHLKFNGRAHWKFCRTVDGGVEIRQTTKPEDKVTNPITPSQREELDQLTRSKPGEDEKETFKNQAGAVLELLLRARKQKAGSG